MQNLVTFLRINNSKKYFFSKSFFCKQLFSPQFCFARGLSDFLVTKKFKKIYFPQITLEKNIFLKFLSQKSYYILHQKKTLQKKIIFLDKKFWEIFFSLFEREESGGGGELLGNLDKDEIVKKVYKVKCWY